MFIKVTTKFGKEIIIPVKRIKSIREGEDSTCIHLDEKNLNLVEVTESLDDLIQTLQGLSYRVE